MYIRNRALSAGFKLLLAVAAAAGLALHFGLLSGGRVDFGGLRYYTLLSNLLCFVYFLADGIAVAACGHDILARFKGALTMGITVTGLVYHVMLSGIGFSMQSAMAAANQLLHTFVPLMALLDWLLFDRKGRYRPSDPLLWVLLPDIYFVYATLRGFLGGPVSVFPGGSRFPYFFMDYDLLGWRVLLYVTALHLFFYPARLSFLRYRPAARQKGRLAPRLRYRLMGGLPARFFRYDRAADRVGSKTRHPALRSSAGGIPTEQTIRRPDGERSRNTKENSRRKL